MTLAHVAYNAYCDRRAWKSVNGEDLPAFGNQSQELKDAWQAAADAVEIKVLDRQPNDGLISLLVGAFSGAAMTIILVLLFH